MLDKKKIWAIFLFQFKMGPQAAETTCNINNTFSPGTANKCTVQWWFKKICKGDESLEDEEQSGWPSEVNNDHLRAIIKVDPLQFSSVQISSVTQLCLTLCNPMNRSTPGLPAHHQLPEFTQTHVHWVSDAIKPCYPLLSPSPPTFNCSQHQGLFKWVSFSHQVAKVLEFQLQHQSFQWTPRTDLL